MSTVDTKQVANAKVGIDTRGPRARGDAPGYGQAAPLALTACDSPSDNLIRFTRRSEVHRLRRAVLERTVVALVVAALASPAAGQLGGRSVSEDSGPVSEMSTNVRTNSRPVHEGGRSVRESSVGSLSGNSTRESSVAPMKSGTFSDISAGTVGSARSLRREIAQERLAPAPPRLRLERAEPAPIYWEPVYELDGLVEDLGSIEPLEREEDLGEADAAEEPVTADSSATEDPNLPPDIPAPE